MSAMVPRCLEVSSSGMADWASIQTDILGKIIRMLPIPDYIRFRAVCTSWNNVCKDVSYRPRVDPWLMLPREQNPLGAQFFCIPERKNQSIRLPSTASLFESVWAPVGSLNGWIIYFRQSDGTMQLVNPISGKHIQLPLIGRRTLFKAKLLEMNERNFIVAVLYADEKGYKITRKGSSAWSSVDSKFILDDIIKHRGLLYTCDMYGTVEMWAEPPHAWPDEEVDEEVDEEIDEEDEEVDEEDEEVDEEDEEVDEEDEEVDEEVMGPDEEVMHRWRFRCLIETPAGDLIKVKRLCQNKFAVWILDKVTLSWVGTENIGDLALFVSHYNSFCFPANDHPNLKPNCVYFIDMHNNLCAFNLENETKELVKILTIGQGKRRNDYYRRPQRDQILWFIPSLE